MFEIKIEKAKELPSRSKARETEATKKLREFPFKEMNKGECITLDTQFEGITHSFLRELVKQWNSEATIENPFVYTLRGLDEDGQIMPTVHNVMSKAKRFRIYRTK